MDNIEVIQTVSIPLGQIVENRGQLEGLPANPRKISISKLNKLVQSIREYPGMVALRELLVYPYKGKYIIIGGNMRRRALKELGYADAPCKVIPEGTSIESLRAYVLRDNSHFGEWDFSVEGFDFREFDLSCVELPVFSAPPIAPSPVQEIQNTPPRFGRERRTGGMDAWNIAISASRCGEALRPHATQNHALQKRVFVSLIVQSFGHWDAFITYQDR